MKLLSRIVFFAMLGVCFTFGARLFAREADSEEKKSEKPSKGKRVSKDDDLGGKSSGDENLSGPAFPKGAQVYTACNLWYERPTSLWCINYKRGKIIPAGTPVKDLRIGPGLMGTRRGKPTILFTTPTDDEEYQLHFDPLTHPKFTIRDYAERLFTTKTFAELTKGMTEREIEAIKEGKLKIGMSRKAVLASWGYPPEHKTKSLEENVWIYWTGRFHKKAVYFDENGKTMREPGLAPDEL